jgi:hypothetical protein
MDAPTAATTVDDSLLQYGAVGIMASIFATVAIKLYGQLQGSNRDAMEQLKSAHAAEVVRMEASFKAAIDRSDAAYQNEKLRADRMEAELRDINGLINDKLAVAIVRANDIVREMLETTTERRRP